MREEYVEKDGKVVDQIEKDKNYVKNLVIILTCFFLVIFLFFVGRSIMQNSTCNKMITAVQKASLSYAKEKEILPQAEGDFIHFSLSDLLDTKKIKKEEVTVNKETAEGKIKITRYKKDYIVTVELTDCAYCDSSLKKWGKEVSKKPRGAIIDVIAYYNYQKKSINFTPFTNWLESDKLKEKSDEKYNIRLPLEEEHLPQVPGDAIIDVIEQETKEYYRYRDKKCKYYQDNGGIYTDYFSSEQPNGYANADDKTLKYTEWSDYSLNYPEKKSYRQIESHTGYKWYYINEKGKKVYYKNGAYAVEVISSQKYVKDSKAGSAKMYRYRDKQWRFYNGAKRKYSSYTTFAPRGYTLKDNDLCQYSSWSSWSDHTKITNENRAYREEEVDTRYRFRIKYSILSLPVFDKPVTKEKIEENLQQSIDQILTREDLHITITYKFKEKK